MVFAPVQKLSTPGARKEKTDDREKPSTKKCKLEKNSALSKFLHVYSQKRASDSIRIPKLEKVH